MAFAKSFDTIFTKLITAFNNQIPNEDTSIGSYLYRVATGVSSLLWGFHFNQDKVVDQVHASTANRDGLERQAFDFGVDLTEGEDTNDLRDRVQDQKRNKPAGGTKADYEREAKAVTGVESALVLGPEVEGDGEVGVVLTSAIPTGANSSTTASKLIDATLSQFISDMFDAVTPRFVKNNDTGDYASITSFDSTSQLGLSADIFPVAGGTGVNYTVHYRIPSSAVVSNTQSAIDDFQPVTATANVRAAVINSIRNIVMTVSGNSANIPDIILGIDSHVNNLAVGETLFTDQLKAIAVNNGADSASVSSPSSDISPGSDEIILLGSVAVT